MACSPPLHGEHTAVFTTVMVRTLQHCVAEALCHPELACDFLGLILAEPCRRLFSLPTEVKQQYPLDPAKNIGWEWQSQVRPSTGFPDQKESMCAPSAADCTVLHPPACACASTRSAWSVQLYACTPQHHRT